MSMSEFKKIEQIQEQLEEIVVTLRLEQLYEDEEPTYLLNAGTKAADFLLESTESEREFILHKLAPDLEIEDVYETNHIILKLK
jgi:hypothetical protein